MSRDRACEFNEVLGAIFSGAIVRRKSWPPTWRFSAKDSIFLNPSDLRAADWYVLGWPEEKKPLTKTVWLWRYKNYDRTHWKVARTLLTEAEAQKYYQGTEIEKHSGPYEVSE